MATVKSSSVVSAEVLTCALSKLGKSELVLKEEQKLAIFSLFSGRDCCMAANGIREECVSKLFCLCSTGSTLGWDPSVKKNDVVLYTLFVVTLRCE